jgi:hypothetical protein
LIPIVCKNISEITGIIFSKIPTIKPSKSLLLRHIFSQKPGFKFLVAGFVAPRKNDGEIHKENIIVHNIPPITTRAGGCELSLPIKKR